MRVFSSKKKKKMRVLLEYHGYYFRILINYHLYQISGEEFISFVTNPSCVIIDFTAFFLKKL